MHNKLARVEPDTGGAMGIPGVPSVRDRLRRELEILDRRRAEIEEAMLLLDRNPDTERLMDLIRG